MEDENLFQFDDDDDQTGTQPEMDAEEAPADEVREENEEQHPTDDPIQEEAAPSPNIPEPDRARLEWLEQERQRLYQENVQKEEYMRQLRSVAGAFGYEGDDQGLLNYICAQARGMTPEEYERQAQAERQAHETALRSDPRYQKMVEFEQRQRANLRMMNDLASIKEAFPQEQASSMEHIRNVEQYLDYFKRGIPAVEAYKLANYDMLARPAQKPDGADKAHMIPACGGAGGQQEPPGDVMELYRRLNPDVSRGDIIKHWNKSKGA